MTVYRLLIVDDEPMVADGLYDIFKNIDYLELDVYRVYSGVDAIEWLNRTKIDIVLTDINMPKITGLQLLEEIYRNWPQCRVIFLTGYNEFDYVYQAIQYQGVSYLMKTEPYEKIIQAVEKSVQDIEDSIGRKEVLNGLDQKVKTASELLKKEYLLELLNTTRIDREAQQQSFVRLGIALNTSFPVFLLIGRIDDLQPDLDYEQRTQCFLAIKHIAEKYFSTNVSVTCITDEKLNVIWLLQPPEPEQEKEFDRSALFISGMLETIQGAANKALNITISFAFTNVPYKWLEVSEKYYLLRERLDCRIGNGTEMILTGETPDFQEEEDTSVLNNPVKQTLLNRINVLEIYLERGDKSSYTYLLKQMTDSLKGIVSMNYMPAQEIYLNLSLILLSYINRYALLQRVAFKTALYKLTHIDEHKSWEQAAEYLFEISDILFELQSNEQKLRTQDTMVQIKEFISGHIMEELSLVRLAETVHFNPSYLSRLFKQEVGMNLSDYITDIRIKKAKRLLEDTEMKIQDISDAVGYDSPTNLGRVFKKATGLTPQEYRNFYNK